ncbi:ficolin-1 [Exaiptasia diaphana]|uniref:Fibrinogen C-terminal domain-containing protein n=1 Tax=Exaiptasia diaphana TaxID=2652724 RepID=A0A913XNI1_EXADI|nr:ficolin-1 [Exaiptasia diaphana]
MAKESSRFTVTRRLEEEDGQSFREEDGSVDFYRGWADYKKGFGDLKGEFWLGLDKIHRLTHQTRNRLRVEIENTKGKSAYSEYDFFDVTSERSKYKLGLGTYSVILKSDSHHHRQSKDDERLAIQDLRRLKPFIEVAKRSHGSFQDIGASALSGLDKENLDSWLDKHKKNISVEL